MNKSYSKIRHIQESNMILEQRRRKILSESNYRNRRSITEAVIEQIMWTSCGGDNTELSDESKELLQLGDKVGDKQLYYFSSEPQDTVGEYKIMDCLGPEVNKKNDLEMVNYEGKNYLYKYYG